MAGLLQGIPEFNNDNNHCDKIGEQLKCPTCQKMFDTPLLLPCMHTFCLKCIENSVIDPNVENQKPAEGGNQEAPPAEQQPPAEGEAPAAEVHVSLSKKIACPECKETIEMKDSVLDTVPIHYLLQNEIEAFESRQAGGPRCGECIEKSEVVDFCTTCPLSMCGECSQYHRRLKKYASHAIKRAVDVSEEQLLQGYKKYCDLHKNEFELRYFCTQCKVCICSECKDSRKHKEHEVFLASEVLEEEKELVDADIKKGLDASRNLKDFLEVAEQMLQKSEEEKGKSITAIEQSFDSVRKMLDAQKAQLINSITQNHEAGKKSLAEAKQKASTLNKLLDYTQTALDVAGQFGNIEVVAVLKTQMENMYTALDVPQISDAAVALPADGAAANQPTVEVLGVVNTMFDQSKGKINVQVKKKVVEVKQDKLTTMTETCKNAMVLFDQN